MLEKKKIETLALERMNELDTDLFIVSLSLSASNAIHLEIDKMNGQVTIDDCVSVSRNIEHNLDRETEDFELEVSSAGLDQPLRVIKQYIKNIGREVKVVLIEGNKVLEGELIQADEKGIVLKTASKELVEGKKKKELVVREIELPFDKIRETKIIISFNKK
ncbi:MAG: ribosome assembly cofactor RimP [Brumimicrobium sp.]|nr:ribosome assembly cofactor RimP [Brumimicrobium sp.]MCO5269520.1 ribosome assembly cofactor RimP [Brumimicrobium sp.]